MQNECANNDSTLSLSVFSHFLPAIPSVSDPTQGKGARNVNSVEENIQFITEASFTKLQSLSLTKVAGKIKEP